LPLIYVIFWAKKDMVVISFVYGQQQPDRCSLTGPELDTIVLQQWQLTGEMIF